MEPGCHDPDDLVRLAVDHQGPADDSRIATASAHPDPVAEDDHVRALASLLFGERAADDRRGAQQIEQAGRDRGGGHALGLAVTADRPLGRPDPFQPLEESGPLAKPDELQGVQRIRMGEVGHAGRLREDAHEAFGVLEGKRPEQHRVGDEKHGASRSDDERERDDADRREPAPGRERAQGESDMPAGIHHQVASCAGFDRTVPSGVLINNND
jgi:hypothetical protein